MTTPDDDIRIAVSKDRLCAHLIVAAADAADITSDNIFLKLSALGIPATEEVSARVKEVVEAVEAGNVPGEPVLMAQGREPVPGKPATFTMATREGASRNDEKHGNRADFYQSRIVTVNEGDLVGTLAPEVPPVPGQDVFGKPIPGEKLLDSVQLGENVRLGEDKRTVIAAASGKVQLARHKVSVVKVVEIDGDVDFSSGNVESPADVVINGTVRETFKVRSHKSVTVKGTIEGATVEAGADIQVHGGIAARGKGRIKAGGGISTKFCEGADLEAGGNVTVVREVMHSRVHTTGRLLVPQGSLIGGYTYAREGAEVKALGNGANIKTEIAIGVDPITLAETRQADRIIEKKQETAAAIRKRVQPLMAQLNRLTPTQRERAAGLMREADQMDAEVQEHERKKAASAAHKSPASDPTLLIGGWLHPGAVVIVGDRMAVIDKDHRGPIRIARRVVDRVQEIVLMDQVSGSVTVLPSYEHVPEAAAGDSDR